MSVLQEYESVRSSMGYRKFDAISNYLEEKCPKEVVDKYYEEMNSILDLPFCEFVEKVYTCVYLGVIGNLNPPQYSIAELKFPIFGRNWNV